MTSKQKQFVSWKQNEKKKFISMNRYIRLFYGMTFNDLLKILFLQIVLYPDNMFKKKLKMEKKYEVILRKLE